jgi:hypothetical protein
MWATIGIPPFEITSLQLGISNDIIYISLLLNKIHTTTLDKINSPCRSYNSTGFNVCSQKFFSSKINCIIPGGPIIFFQVNC